MSSSAYVGPLYEQNAEVSFFHSMPRFGRPSDIAVLTSSNQNAPMQYTLGIIFLSVVIFSLFVICAAVLFGLQCMGPNSVGFWSGDGFMEPKDYNERPYLRPRRVRITFIFCAIMVIVFSVLLVWFGLRKVSSTVVALEGSTSNVNTLLNEGSKVAGSLTKIAQSVASVQSNALINLSTFCPNQQNLSAILGNNLNSSQISNAINSVKNFITGDLTTFNLELDKIKGINSEISMYLQSYKEWKFRPLYWMPLILLSCAFIVGTILAWWQRSPYTLRCLQAYVLLPLFTIWIVFSWLAAGALAAGIVANSDTCSGGQSPGSPDGTVMSVLSINSIKPNSIYFSAAEYYVGGCRTSDPFSFISNYRAKLASASVVAGTFINAIDKFGTSQLSQVCGTNVTTTVDALNVLQSSMKSLLGTAQQAESLLACERINLIYVQAVHESLCRNAVNGLTWVIVCLIVISICGMIMIGLRSALLHIKYRDKTVELAQCVPFDAPERLQTRKESYCSDQNFERNSVPESHTQSISHSWEDQHVNTRSIPSHSSEDQHVNNQRTSHSWQNQHAENIEMDFNASTHSRRPPAEAPLGQSSSSEVSQVVAYIPDNAKHCSFGQPKEYDRAGASRESWNDDCEAGNAVPGDHDLGSKDDNSLAEYQNESFEHEHEESSLSDSCEGYPTRFEISTSNSLDEGLLPSISQDAAIVCSDYRQNATSEV